MAPKVTISALFVCLLTQASLAAVIKGTVTGEGDAKPLVGVNVTVLGTKLGSSTTMDGTYRITGIPVGTHILRTTSLAFVTQTDTITVLDSADVVVHNVVLKIPWVESTPWREQYHQRLAEENLKAPILTMHIDYFSFRKGFVTLHVSMRNNSSMSISLLRVFEGINPTRVIVKDSAGKTIHANLTMADWVGQKIFPDRNDVIPISASETIDYPAVKVWNYDFSRLPEGTYSIAFVYTFQKPKQLCCYGFPPDYRKKYNDVIDVLTTVLRGTYVSTNTITIDNRH